MKTHVIRMVSKARSTRTYSCSHVRVNRTNATPCPCWPKSTKCKPLYQRVLGELRFMSTRVFVICQHDLHLVSRHREARHQPYIGAPCTRASRIETTALIPMKSKPLHIFHRAPVKTLLFDERLRDLALLECIMCVCASRYQKV